MSEETAERTQDREPREAGSAQGQGREPDREHDNEAPADQRSLSQPDSMTFARCATCTSAEELDAAAGTLLCKKHNMRINAEADEIPDDCVEFELKHTT